MLDLVVLGGGPAGTGPLVWAAQHGKLAAWLDRGIAVVERSAGIGGTLGQYAINADSLGTSFLECLDAPAARALFAPACAQPATRAMEQRREAYPTLRLVAEFEHCLGRALADVITAHPGGTFLPHTGVEALHINCDGSVTVQVAQGGTLTARAAIFGLGGRQDSQALPTRELLPGVRLCDVDPAKIMLSGRLLTDAGLAQARATLAAAGSARTVILGGSHSAFSALWALLHALSAPPFGAGDIALVYRREPRIYYPARAAAQADDYAFCEQDVCPKTQRVHRMGGLRNDGREIWRRLSRRPGAPPEPRASMTLLSDPAMSAPRLRRLLDEAALVIPALGYRFCTVPVYDAAGRRVRLMAEEGMPAVDPYGRLRLGDGGVLPNVFGLGLGSGFRPWGEMAGEPGFDRQQNSLWLFQHGLGRMIYEGVRAATAQSACRSHHAVLLPATAATRRQPQGHDAAVPQAETA